MSSYIGHYAQLYDQIYADKPYAQEAAFVSAVLKRSGKKASRLLELASGTGTHALLLEKMGYKVTATDYSDSMLAVAKNKLTVQKSSVVLRKLDMRKLSLFHQPFDAILCLFDSIGYVVTNDAVQRVLSGVRKNLTNDGVFIFEFWHAPAMLRHFDPYRRRTFHLANRHALYRVSKTTLDYVQNTATVAYTLDEFSGRKRVCHLEETQTNRFFSIPEMELLLTLAKLKAAAFYSGYSANKKISDQSFHILCVAKKL